VVVRVVARRNTDGGQTAAALRASHRNCRERRLPALRIDPNGKRSKREVCLEILSGARPVRLRVRQSDPSMDALDLMLARRRA
jgi:hypothetical protein